MKHEISLINYYPMSIREAIHAKTGSIFVEGGALTSFLARSAKIAPSSPNTRSTTANDTGQSSDLKL